MFKCVCVCVCVCVCISVCVWMYRVFHRAYALHATHTINVDTHKHTHKKKNTNTHTLIWPTCLGAKLQMSSSHIDRGSPPQSRLAKRSMQIGSSWDYTQLKGLGSCPQAVRRCAHACCDAGALAQPLATVLIFFELVLANLSSSPVPFTC